MTPAGDGGDQPPDPDDGPPHADRETPNADSETPHDDTETPNDGSDTSSTGDTTHADDTTHTDDTTYVGDWPQTDDTAESGDDRAGAEDSPLAPNGGPSSARTGSNSNVAGGPARAGGTHAAGTDDGGGEEMNWGTFVYDVVSSAVAVLLVGALLFAVSGVWPPMVAVESPSMTPHMQTGDLVFVMEEQRFPGEGAHGSTGVVPAHVGQNTSVDYRKFRQQGDVIVYRPRGNNQTTPIIHRAMFWVEEGENWYDEADRQAVGRYSECGETPSEAMPNCPAPHAGFITKGDANAHYDQVEEMSGPVKPAWIVGTAELRIPKLGCVRLRTKGCAALVTGASNTTSAIPHLATTAPHFATTASHLATTAPHLASPDPDLASTVADAGSRLLDEFLATGSGDPPRPLEHVSSRTAAIAA